MRYLLLTLNDMLLSASLYFLPLSLIYNISIFLPQLKFLFMSVVTDVQVQGRKSTTVHFVKSYRLEYSVDCITFTSVLDQNGTNKVCELLIA